jgi:hypothetical protein
MPPGSAGDTSVASPVLIDAHAHFWEGYDLERFLDAAWRNLESAARGLGLADPVAHALLLMDAEPQGLFQRVAEGKASDVCAWILEATDEAGSLRASRGEAEGEGEPLLLVQGRQVVTAEGLELLAAPCPTVLPSRLSVDETLAAVSEARAVPILPWGFGKWWGARGRLVASILESRRPSELLIGDNGGRARLAWKPRLLTLAAQRGFLILRGSDPLPIAGDDRRAGSFGSLLHGHIDSGRPAESVRQLLGHLGTQPRQFGSGAALSTFFSNQVRVRIGGSR